MVHRYHSLHPPTHEAAMEREKVESVNTDQRAAFDTIVQSITNALSLRKSLRYVQSSRF